MPNRKPFSRDEFPDLTKAISEIVAPKKTEEKKKAKPDKWGGKEPYVKNDRNPYTAPHKKVNEACWKGYTAKGTKRKGDRMVPDCVKTEEVVESHTRAQLEKLSTTRLRELLKQYTGKPGSGRELADIRGLLRSKGAGSVVDEGFEADERAAARSARVRKWMGRLKKANAADLKDKPGAAGEAAHKRLHKTIKGVVGESMTAAEIGKAMEPSRAAQRPKIRAAMKAKLKAKHGGAKGNADERMGRNTQRYKSGPTQGWTGD